MGKKRCVVEARDGMIYKEQVRWRNAESAAKANCAVLFEKQCVDWML
jgi:hypothetical protein